MKTVEINVKGMHCRSCEMLVEDALEDIGVDESKAGFTENKVKVRFDEEKIDESSVRKVIEDEGYEVV